jgi:hypothetical protein
MIEGFSTLAHPCRVRNPGGITPTTVNGTRCTVSWRPTMSLANHTDHAVERIQRGVRIVVHPRAPHDV